MGGPFLRSQICPHAPIQRPVYKTTFGGGGVGETPQRPSRDHGTLENRKRTEPASKTDHHVSAEGHSHRFISIVLTSPRSVVLFYNLFYVTNKKLIEFELIPRLILLLLVSWIELIIRKKPSYKMTAAVCRVCLASNIRMLCIRKSKLQYIYEKLSASKVSYSTKDILVGV